jgi:glycosidase
MDRFASLESNIKKQQLAAALLLLIGGVPSIYYGQEIGMQGKFGKWGNTDGNDIPRRAAFDWYKSGQGKGMATWYKNTGSWWDSSEIKPNDGISAEEQLNDSNSLLNYYKSLIQLKQSNSALANGKYATATNNNNKVFSFYRKYENRIVLVAVNLSDVEQTAIFEEGHKKYIPLMGKAKVHNSSIDLSPYEIAVFEVK